MGGVLRTVVAGCLTVIDDVPVVEMIFFTPPARLVTSTSVRHIARCSADRVETAGTRVSTVFRDELSVGFKLTESLFSPLPTARIVVREAGAVFCSAIQVRRAARARVRALFHHVAVVRAKVRALPRQGPHPTLRQLVLHRQTVVFQRELITTPPARAGTQLARLPVERRVACAVTQFEPAVTLGVVISQRGAIQWRCGDYFRAEQDGECGERNLHLVTTRAAQSKD